MKLEEKKKARELRKKGRSINQIVEALGYSKASVSVWVRDIVLTKAQQEKISKRGRSVRSIEMRRVNRLANEEKKRQLIIDKAKKSIRNISKRDLKLIGASLYLGEGSKMRNGVVAVTNSDPMIIQIMLRFLKEICGVPKEKFRGHIHTFAHANIEETEKFWSRLTGIPRRQFFKTYTKPSSASLQKRKTLPFGTFDLCVCDTKLKLTILGWIEKIKELIIK